MKSQIKQILIFGLLILTYLSFFNKFTSVFRINADKASQLQATHNFYSGNGLTVEDVRHSDLSKREKKPLIGWPPGYTILLTMLHPLTGNFIISTSLLNYIFLFLYLAITYLILKILEIPTGYIVVFFLFTLLSNHPVLNLTTTDLIGLVLFLGMFVLFLYGYKKNVTHWGIFACVGVLGFFSAFVKYNFLPFVFLFPLLYLFVGFYQKRREILYGGILCGAVLLTLVSAFLLYQKFYTGHYTYLTAYASGKQFYWFNLGRHSPFPFELLFVRDPFKLISFPLPRLVTFVPHLFSIVLLSGIVYVVVSKVKTGFTALTANIYSLTLVAGILTISLNVVMLLYLSVTSPPGDRMWTYVEEFRYFAPACFFILLFLLLSAARVFPFTRVSWAILVTSLVFIAVLKAYKVKSYGFEALLEVDRLRVIPANDDQLVLLRRVKEIVKEASEPVVYGDRSSNQRLMDLANAGIIWQFDDFVKAKTISSSSPVVVLIAVPREADPELSEFIHKYDFRQVLLTKDSRLYRLDYTPG